ncbi:uncharacterized protein LOC132609483 isoform X1 [Lycium barbarum]|uniref:uncharacterized protein LOC132609483 isoform X1 n=1 Tax=Lycium barbarum TaxID=112863 RepID=UPI00293F3ADC|nr:uncharacterized protein LOC132609483 isoform X1 [Lycium barbarum]XP_060179454.1 uncharacterized protein LOC132609483 isoform X1 [Lycium barbarum]XP_060179455.1 uncharacterized protein LOC132609483 isoform X1 [Lycium barbarum]
MSPLLPIPKKSRNPRPFVGFKSFRKMVPIKAPEFKRLRRSALVLGVSNALIIIMGVVIVIVARNSCGHKGIAPVIVLMVVSLTRICAMIGTGIAQQHTASSILTSQTDLPDSQAAIRHQRRRKYRRLLLWTRIASVITMVQLLGAVFLLFSVTNLFHRDTASSNCLRGILSNGSRWQRNMLILFMVITSYVAPVQCFAGADVLRWRSFYATEDNAWRAHYREVFDHGIREALCCLGRVKYLTVLEEDEVCSVAQLLGDLVTYRASGTGHLELLAGLALLQNPRSFSKSYEESMVVPLERMREAAFYHPFAEAAYTGLLLDIGRNPVLFSCSWLYRQGILAPWLWNRRPLLEGDNWWRGHAAAFLKHVHLSAHMLRKGRVNQGKCKAAYFIVVLHNVKSVVIAVRGTETPEDLITDGLGRECCLTEEELDSLLNGNHFDPCIRQRVVSSTPHHAHSGVVEAARDLYMQVDGNSGDGGFLSSLLGVGCECEGYGVRIVGHSLGGAIAALLGMKLRKQYPDLHVYTYGALPCVGLVVADVCSEFITSIVNNDEFSARLSVASIMRLQAAALKALSEDGTVDITTILKLAHHFTSLTVCQKSMNDGESSVNSLSSCTNQINHSQLENGLAKHEPGSSVLHDLDTDLSSDDKIGSTDSLNRFNSPFNCSTSGSSPFGDPLTEFMEAVPSSQNKSSLSIPELYLPGLVIHIVPQKDGLHQPLWKRLRTWERSCRFRAYVAKREAFKDIIVSPYMFLDHLPWRCQNALENILKTGKLKAPDDASEIV